MESRVSRIPDIISQSIAVKEKIRQDAGLLETVTRVVDELTSAFRRRNKVMFCGNGGSAADAQHLAAELSGRFYFDRKPLPAEALHVNTSYLTAVANDYSYDEIYSRLVEAQGVTGDILVGISTSGNSKNVIKAIEAANALGVITIGMTGSTGGKMKGLCKYLLAVPSDDTPRIQESHILLGHILCELVEENLFPKP